MTKREMVWRVWLAAYLQGRQWDHEMVEASDLSGGYDYVDHAKEALEDFESSFPPPKADST